MTTTTAEIRQLVAGALVAVADGRYPDVHLLLSGVDRDALLGAVEGLSIAVGCVLEELSEERRALLRGQLADWALTAAARACR